MRDLCVTAALPIVCRLNITSCKAPTNHRFGQGALPTAKVMWPRWSPGNSCHVNRPHLLSWSFLVEALGISDRPVVRSQISSFHIYPCKHLTTFYVADCFDTWNKAARPCFLLSSDLILAETYCENSLLGGLIFQIWFQVSCLSWTHSWCEWGICLTRTSWAHLSQKHICCNGHLLCWYLICN